MQSGQPSLHLVSLAAVTWDFKLLGRTRMLAQAWAQAGQPTTFVQVPSCRTGLQRARCGAVQDGPVPVVRPWPALPARLWNVAPARLLHSLTRRHARELRRRLDNLLDWQTAAALVVSPVWTPWLEELPFRHIVYDCIDDLAVHVPRPALSELYRRWEEALIARSAAAVVVATRLADDLLRRRPGLPIRTIRNGVDADGFRLAAVRLPRPADLPDNGRPLIGFVGALYEWIDWELIERTVRASPHYDFVFVGPHDGRSEARRLGGLGNVHLLGYRPYAAVPAYVQAFDVCWVPFKPGDVAAAANPVKIYEYLALGKPVVTTPVADTESFGRLVEVVQTARDAVAAVRALVSHAARDGNERIAFARANSWASRAEAYVEFVSSLS